MRLDAHIGMLGGEPRALRLKFGRVARAQHQRSAAAANCFGDLRAKTEACAGNDCGSSSELHDARPTEMSESRLSAAKAGAKKTPCVEHDTALHRTDQIVRG